MQKTQKPAKSQPATGAATSESENPGPEPEVAQVACEAGATDEAPKKKKRTASGEGGKVKTSKKRGPARPHRKLAQEVLNVRIKKLQKRIERSRGQLEDAERHIESYNKEATYRLEDQKNDQSDGADA
jgi:hypothetical protein